MKEKYKADFAKLSVTSQYTVRLVLSLNFKDEAQAERAFNQLNWLTGDGQIKGTVNKLEGTVFMELLEELRLIVKKNKFIKNF